MEFNPQKQAENPLTQKRQEMTVNIRRQKRKQQIDKRRRMNLLSPQLTDLQIQQKVYQLANYNINIPKELRRMRELIQSGESKDVEEALNITRVIVIDSEDDEIQRVLDLGMLPYILGHARQSKNMGIKKLACWLLACLCSGNHDETEQLIQQGTLKVLNDCLDIQSLATVEQVLWGLANIAGDCDRFRQLIVDSPILEKLESIIKIENINIVQILCWLFGNMARNQERFSFKLFKNLFPGVCEFLKRDNLAEDALEDLAKFISVISVSTEDAKEELVRLNVLPYICSRLTFRLVKEETCITLLFRIVGNFVSSQRVHIVDYAINCGLIQLFLLYINNPSTNIVKEICWTLSNLAAGTSNHSKLIFSNPVLMAVLVQMLQHSPMMIRRQVGWIYTNISQTLSPQLIYNYYKSNNIINHFISFLYYLEDVRSLQVGLEGIKRILQMSQHFKTNGVNPILYQHISEISPRIFGLLESPHKNIVDACQDIIETFDLEEK